MLAIPARLRELGGEPVQQVRVRRQLLVATGLGLLSLTPYVWFLLNTNSSQGTVGTVTRFLGGLGYLVSSPMAWVLGLGWGLGLLLYQFPLTTLVGVLRAGLIGSTPPTVAAIVAVTAAGLALVMAGAASVDRWRGTIPDHL